MPCRATYRDREGYVPHVWTVGLCCCSSCCSCHKIPPPPPSLPSFRPAASGCCSLSGLPVMRRTQSCSRTDAYGELGGKHGATPAALSLSGAPAVREELPMPGRRPPTRCADSRLHQRPSAPPAAQPAHPHARSGSPAHQAGHVPAHPASMCVSSPPPGTKADPPLPRGWRATARRGCRSAPAGTECAPWARRAGARPGGSRDTSPRSLRGDAHRRVSAAIRLHHTDRSRR